MSLPIEPYSLPFSRPACFRGFGEVAVWVGVVPIGYDDAVAAMEARVAGIAAAWAGCARVLGQDAFWGDFKVLRGAWMFIDCRIMIVKIPLTI